MGQRGVNGNAVQLEVQVVILQNRIDTLEQMLRDQANVVGLSAQPPAYE